MLGRSEKSTQKRDSIFHHPITKAVTKKKKNIKAIPMDHKVKKNWPIQKLGIKKKICNQNF
jgi:hypothetical protein